MDGLRFIAIFSVVMFHLHWDLMRKMNFTYIDDKMDYPLLNELMKSGDRGVPIFFVISGFILALPFAKHHIFSTPIFSTKSYFFRRVTRLEPPYFIAMVLLFLVSVLVVKKFDTIQLFLSLLSSLFYCHNILGYYFDLPPVNIVSWSLEIEIQFYILAPLFARIYLVKKKLRRLIMTMVIVVMPVVLHFFKLPFVTLYNYLHFFAAGFLLADIFLTTQPTPAFTRFMIPVGGLLLLTIWFLPLHSDNIFLRLLSAAIFPWVVMGLFYSLLRTTFWKKLISNVFFSTVGGMCYSIYLIHFAVISMTDRFTVGIKFTNYFIADLFIQYIINLIVIAVISASFFVLFEKPFMNKSWLARLQSSFRSGWNYSLKSKTAA